MNEISDLESQRSAQTNTGGKDSSKNPDNNKLNVFEAF